MTAWQGGSRRWPRWAIAVGIGAVAAVAVAIGVLASRPHDARLSLDAFFDVGPVVAPTPSPGQIDSGPHPVVATYRDGGIVRYVFAVHDDGPEPVTVTEVVAPAPSFEALLRPVALGLAAPGIVVAPGTGSSATAELNADTNEPDTEPFHGFTLAPGEDRVVYVWARMGDCEYYMPGSSQTLEDVTIGYTVAGDRRTAVLPLPLPIEVSLPLDVACPRQRPQPFARPSAAPLAPPQAVPPG